MEVHHPPFLFAWLISLITVLIPIPITLNLKSVHTIPTILLSMTMIPTTKFCNQELSDNLSRLSKMEETPPSSPSLPPSSSPSLPDTEPSCSHMRSCDPACFLLVRQYLRMYGIEETVHLVGEETVEEFMEYDMRLQDPEGLHLEDELEASFSAFDQKLETARDLVRLSSGVSHISDSQPGSTPPPLNPGSEYREEVPPSSCQLEINRYAEAQAALAMESTETQTVHCMENLNEGSRMLGADTWSQTPSDFEAFRHQTPFKSRNTSTGTKSEVLVSQESDKEQDEQDGLPVFSCSRTLRAATIGRTNALSTLSRILVESTTYHESAMRMSAIISIVSSISSESSNSKMYISSALDRLKEIRAEAALVKLIATYSRFREHPLTRGTMLESTVMSLRRTSNVHVPGDLTSLATTCTQAAWLFQTKGSFLKTLGNIQRETLSYSTAKSENLGTKRSAKTSQVPTYRKSKRTGSTSIGNATPKSDDGSWRASRTRSPESSPCPGGFRIQKRRSKRT